MTASVYCGPHAIFAAPNLAGNFDTMVELRVQQDWSERFTQVLQSNMGWDANTPVGTGSWYGLYMISIFHLNTQARRLLSRGMVRRRQGDANRNRHQLCRGDPGLQLAPLKCLEIRPEIRGDFAGAPAFGVNGAHTDRSQLTGGISFLVKF